MWKWMKMPMRICWLMTMIIQMKCCKCSMRWEKKFIIFLKIFSSINWFPLFSNLRLVTWKWKTWLSLKIIIFKIKESPLMNSISPIAFPILLILGNMSMKFPNCLRNLKINSSLERLLLLILFFSWRMTWLCIINPSMSSLSN